MVEGDLPSALTRARSASLRRMLRLIARPTAKSATRIGSPFVPGVYKPRALMSPFELEAARARAAGRKHVGGPSGRLIELRDWLFRNDGSPGDCKTAFAICNHRVPSAESPGPYVWPSGGPPLSS